MRVIDSPLFGYVTPALYAANAHKITVFREQESYSVYYAAVLSFPLDHVLHEVSR
jgi:hypothetical protein